MKRTKRLSVIIPTYNMAALLPQCLDSLVRSAAASSLDVVVVNDGSRDASLSIAQRYADHHPDIVRIIDKPNGNYGSTINAALPTLKGEYVKILDADDTFNCSAVVRMVDFLKSVSGVDMVVGPFIEIHPKSEYKINYTLNKQQPYDTGRIYKAEQVIKEGHIPFFMMHSIAYRTELLQQMGYRQSEGISYTDQQWCFFPIFNVQTIAFTDIPLYRYNLTREGQTMDMAVQLKSISQLTEVVLSMAEYLKEHQSEVSKARRYFLAGVVTRRMQGVLRRFLLDMNDKQFDTSAFTTTLEQFKAAAPLPLKVRVNRMLDIDLLEYWQSNGCRYPQWRRDILIKLDNLMQWVYRLKNY
ncbi:MAG: glycosyltransferase family 2 protein [Alistipes sp.]|nr:glycosyltransferase family 2 protein [Alistipes sp.]